jgi:hypothetical protein
MRVSLSSRRWLGLGLLAFGAAALAAPGEVVLPRSPGSGGMGTGFPTSTIDPAGPGSASFAGVGGQSWNLGATGSFPTDTGISFNVAADARGQTLTAGDPTAGQTAQTWTVTAGAPTVRSEAAADIAANPEAAGFSTSQFGAHLSQTARPAADAEGNPKAPIPVESARNMQKRIESSADPDAALERAADNSVARSGGPSAGAPASETTVDAQGQAPAAGDGQAHLWASFARATNGGQAAAASVAMVWAAREHSPAAAQEWYVGSKDGAPLRDVAGRFARDYMGHELGKDGLVEEVRQAWDASHAAISPLGKANVERNLEAMAQYSKPFPQYRGRVQALTSAVKTSQILVRYDPSAFPELEAAAAGARTAPAPGKGVDPRIRSVADVGPSFALDEFSGEPAGSAPSIDARSSASSQMAEAAHLDVLPWPFAASTWFAAAVEGFAHAVPPAGHILQEFGVPGPSPLGTYTRYAAAPNPSVVTFTVFSRP